MADREKVIKEWEKVLSRDPLDAPWDLIDETLTLLKEQEVKKGKWIEQTDYMGDTYYDCSVCNESWTTIEGTPWVNGMNYCPHCGAKMIDT